MLSIDERVLSLLVSGRLCPHKTWDQMLEALLALVEAEEDLEGIDRLWLKLSL